MLVQNADSVFSVALKDSSNNSIDLTNAVISINFMSPSKRQFKKDAIPISSTSECVVMLSKEDLAEAGFYEYQINIVADSKTIKSNIQNMFVQGSLPEVVTVNG